MRALLLCVALGAAFLILSYPVDAQDRAFGRNECTDDCSGHKAGYEWAEQRGHTVESDCTGNSYSFIEGCRTYVEDPYRGADTDDDGKEID